VCNMLQGDCDGLNGEDCLTFHGIFFEEELDLLQK